MRATSLLLLLTARRRLSRSRAPRPPSSLLGLPPGATGCIAEHKQASQQATNSVNKSVNNSKMDFRLHCYLHLCQQFACGRRGNEYLAAVRVDEALGGAFLEQGKQRVVVAVDVQQPNLREEAAGLSCCLTDKNALLIRVVIFLSVSSLTGLS